MGWLRAHGGSARGVGVATESTLHGGGLVATEDLEAGEAANITPIALPAPVAPCCPCRTLLPLSRLPAPVASTAVSATHIAVAVSTTFAALARCGRPHRAVGAHAHGW